MLRGLRGWTAVIAALLACHLIGVTGAQSADIAVISPFASLDQGRNGTPSSPNEPVVMQNGNAGASNSHYREGHSIPYRLVLENLPGPLNNVKIAWDVRHSGKNALDYVTHFQRLNPHHFTPDHSSESVDPLLGLVGSFSSPSDFPIPVPNSTGSPVLGQPTNSFNLLPLGERVMTIYNGTITNMSYVNQGDLTEDQSSTQLSIDFTASGPTVVLAWGGHIASEVDWGVGNSASRIGGSPYHMRLIELDGQGGHHQDRSLAAEAVEYAFLCDVGGFPSPCTAVNTVNTYTAAVIDVTDATYSWAFGSNTSGASFVGPTNKASVKVNSGTTSGSFTLLALVTAAQLTSSCTRRVDVCAISDTPSGAAEVAPRIFAWPNPSAGSMTFRCTMPAGRSGRLQIYDVVGHCVRDLPLHARPLEFQDVSWDARDESGRMLPSGVYLIRLVRAGATTHCGHVSILH